MFHIPEGEAMSLRPVLSYFALKIRLGEDSLLAPRQPWASKKTILCYPGHQGMANYVGRSFGTKTVLG